MGMTWDDDTDAGSDETKHGDEATMRMMKTCGCRGGQGRVRQDQENDATPANARTEQVPTGDGFKA